MKVIETALIDVKIIEPKVFGDDRGFFFESYNQKTLNQALNLDVHFVQDNHSFSGRGVLRGLHYQVKNPQGKLVRVVSGEAFDVAVDIRKHSPTFGKWIGLHLSSTNKKMLWIPPGFAHGFLVLSPNADFLYKTTEFYDPSSEGCIRWDDPEIAIQWPLNGIAPIVSAKDALGKRLSEALLFT